MFRSVKKKSQSISVTLDAKNSIFWLKLLYLSSYLFVAQLPARWTGSMKLYQIMASENQILFALANEFEVTLHITGALKVKTGPDNNSGLLFLPMGGHT